MPLSEPQASHKPTGRPLLVASIVAAAFFMETLDSTVIVTALPKMAETFERNPVDLSLGITAYMLTLAVCIPASGWVADRLGTRTVFCSAIGVFTLASMLCGFTDDLWSFVAARILQGLGGAMMSPVGRLAVLRTTEKKDLVRAINFLTVPGLIGPVIGPPVGGFITTYLSWRWIFFLNLPIGLLGMFLVHRYVQNHFGQERRPFDRKGFLLNGGALAFVMYGMDLVGSGQAGWLPGGSLIALGAVFAFFAIRHALSYRYPLVDLSAMRRKSFAVTNTGGTVYRLTISAPAFLMPLMFQLALGMSAFVSGLLILAHTSGDLVAKAVTTVTMRWLGFRSVLIWSAIGYGIFLGACGFFTTETSVTAMVLILFTSGVFRSFQMTALTSMQFADIPANEMTAASTLSSVMQQVVRGGGVACAAIMLNLLVAFRGAEAGALSLLDFQIAFVVTALTAIASVFWYVPLAPGLGAEVSGHRSAD